VYSLVVVFVNVIGILVFMWGQKEILFVVSFALVGEGGFALVVGGVVASFSSKIGKVSEMIFRSEPWDSKRLRENEVTARTWIVTGAFLFLIGILVSVL
jgi:hypothetical protein